MVRRLHRRVAAAALAALLLTAPASAALPRFVVAVPGVGERRVDIYWSHLTYEGVFVLQGEAGRDAPCVPFPASLHCVVAAGPLSSVTLFYTPLAPTCTERAAVRVFVDGVGRPEQVDAGTTDAACVYLPMGAR